MPQFKSLGRDQVIAAALICAEARIYAEYASVRTHPVSPTLLSTAAHLAKALAARGYQGEGLWDVPGGRRSH